MLHSRMVGTSIPPTMEFPAVSVSFLILFLSGLLILAGIVGAIVQIWPSGPFIAGGILLWAFNVNTPLAWSVFVIALVVLAVAFVAKFVIPGRKLAQSGIPNSTLIAGLVGAVVGYFIIPVVGFIVGLIAVIYAMEYLRLQSPQDAWKATLEALKIVGLSIVIELLAALVATTAWIGGLIFTALGY